MSERRGGLGTFGPIGCKQGEGPLVQVICELSHLRVCSYHELV